MNADKRLFKKLGRRISRLGLGTAQFGMDYGYSKALSQTEVNQILDLAHKNGINFLDTARDYGDSESKISVFLKSSENRFIVATKLISEDSLRHSVRELKVGTLPLALVHQTDVHVTHNPDFWKNLEEINRGDIYARALGISVYDPETTKSILEIEYAKNRRVADLVDCIQAPYNLLNRRFEEDRELIDLLEKKGIAFISRSTFLKGTLVEENIPEELEELTPIREKLRKISLGSGFSVPQLLLFFALDADFIDCTLIGVRSTEQLQENLDTWVLCQSVRFQKAKEELLNISVDNAFLTDPRRWSSLK